MIIKCKMCGGDLHPAEGTTTCECEFCGTLQTIPSADDDKKMTLFGRAQCLLFACDFDKAAGIYESIVADFPTEAEAYWGLVLCKYGIEYVDDPGTKRKIPTCHRTSFESVFDDANFDQANENADPVARKVYREEAKRIEELRKKIIEVSGKEEPYDIFICYKETDENGERTLDSVLAQDIYNELTVKGYRVFFSRITLEDKLGQEYEPYIFAALNSAKIMLAVGTDYEYYNAVWVKNEWSRFLKLIANGEKKTLIPCYKNIDAYDMPKEFAKLQAQDMSKLGWMQDLTRGIEKLLQGNQPEKQGGLTEQDSANDNAKIKAAVKRGYLALEDAEWDEAKKFFDTALNYEAECADAYLGIVLAEFKMRDIDSFQQIEETGSISKIRQNPSFIKFNRFAKKERKEEVNELLDNVEKRASDRIDQSKIKIEQVRKRIQSAQGVLAVCEHYLAGVQIDGSVKIYSFSDHVPSNQIEKEISEDFYGITSLSLGTSSLDFSSLTYTMTGLRFDGTITTGYYSSECPLKDIQQIARRSGSLVVLTKDGKVSIVTRKWTSKEQNYYYSVEQVPWEKVKFVAACDSYFIGVGADGTVKLSDECYSWTMHEWKDIVAVSPSGRNAVGLRKDGTVVVAGETVYIEEAEKWHDIVAISNGGKYVVGLKSDGTVITTESENKTQLYARRMKNNLMMWTDIVAIDCEGGNIAGLKSDGTVLILNIYESRGTDGIITKTAGWKLFDNIDTLEQERANKLPPLMKQKRQKLEKKIETKRRLQSERKTLENELNSLSGLFTGRRRHEIEDRLLSIDRELKGL